ncbi:hypothetical protein BZG36_03009 [Bifiguratus adelaidae]|uniref:J domain-containing protein n=1 Tax=Bifiguratus adelaidae TaxID=1938954 RepID=A0A261XZJ2_9FUNG|nr:hypothetical protein BZG36_03009 [Bifiguratus adelaidae]
MQRLWSTGQLTQRLPCLACQRRLFATPSDDRPPDSLRYKYRPAKTPFEALGLPATASTQMVKKTYYQLCKLYHPDALGLDKDSQDAKETFNQIVRAYEVLSDPSRRRLYVQHGIGWDALSPYPGATSHPSQASAWTPGHRPASYTNAYWAKSNTFHDDPTYKGGEWYDPKNPRFFSNPAFASIIAALVVLGAAIQYATFESQFTSVRAAANRHHERTSRDLREAREQAKLFGRQAVMERIYDERMKYYRRSNAIAVEKLDKDVGIRDEVTGKVVLSRTKGTATAGHSSS